MLYGNINANLNVTPDDPVWYFLAEFSLSQFLTGHDYRGELTAGFLYQAVRELGMPPAYVEHMEMTLAAFAKEALEHFKQESLEIPGNIRVFCQKKAVLNGGWG